MKFCRNNISYNAVFLLIIAAAFILSSATSYGVYLTEVFNSFFDFRGGSTAILI